MEFRYKKLRIFIIVLIVITMIIVIIYLVKFNPVRILRLKKLSYLYELDQNYNFKKRANTQPGTRIVISMTTIPDRLPYLYPALSSILDQSVFVDKIYLNLPKISRKGKPYVLPDWFNDLKNIKVVWLDTDFGPATKLIPSLLKEDKTTRIVVLDDDNLYHYRTVERLVNAFEKKNQKDPLNPKYAISTFGVRLNCNGRLPNFVSFSRLQIMFSKSSRVDHLQGCYGFIVTPSMFPYEVFDQESAPDCVKSVDDEWFSSWLALNKIQIWTLDYSFWILPLHDRGDVNCTPSLFNGENKGFIPEHKIIDWFRLKHGYKSLNE